MTSVQDVRSSLNIPQHAAKQGRVVIETVRPEVDCGQFPIKRVVGESVTVEADIFADGHDQVASRLLYRSEHQPDWSSTPMRPLGNDRWQGSFSVPEQGKYRYTIEGWVDPIETWRVDLLKRIGADQDVGLELLAGAALIEQAASRAGLEHARRLREWAVLLRNQQPAVDQEELFEIARLYPERSSITRYQNELSVVVDRVKARFSTWYELFPRSCAPHAAHHGTFRDCETWLPYVAYMGFDVLYFPPIHPIGNAYRKGRNNSVAAEPGDVGSPWAIGSIEGGHKSIHPALGTIEDFHRLLAKARDQGLEIALDLAYQCTPDHPYVREHPEWFRTRPDGTIQYAENPPKKYQDIYPLNFDTIQWRALWDELKSVVVFWIEQGVRIFRVDNPHTKPFAFWEWLIAEIKREYPDVLFLSEAFTRPRVMYRLAKLGFSQSYTYFAWRNSKQELTDYFEELTQTDVGEYFCANLWPNTPDILTAFLQEGGRPAFMIRLLLAATLGANYGIYGPAFELLENAPREPGSEEYLNSEKYELKHRAVLAQQSLAPLIARVNEIRRGHAALQQDRNLRFHDTDNPMLICYSKTTADLSDVILTVVNLDPTFKQAGWVYLDLKRLGLDPVKAFVAEDLLGGAAYTWHGSRNYVELTPGTRPAHILQLK